MPKCPQCGGELGEVRQTSPKMFNDDQFEATIAGNYYCKICPDNGKGKSGYCYFWKSELKR